MRTHIYVVLLFCVATCNIFTHKIYRIVFDNVIFALCHLNSFGMLSTNTQNIKVNIYMILHTNLEEAV